MRLVAIEVPWVSLGAGEQAKAYLRNCIRDVLSDGDIPWSHRAVLSWTEALYAHDPEQNAETLTVAYNMLTRVDVVVFYIDHGMTDRMNRIKLRAKMLGKPIEDRKIYQMRALPAKQVRSY